MSIARSSVAFASTMLWPVVVLAIPLGVTFSAARVYAEAGRAPAPLCTASTVTSCGDAGAMEACACAAGYDCACTPKECSAASGGVRTALVCDYVTTCKSHAIAPCEGKAAGASCVQTDTAGTAVATGTCVSLTNGCLAKSDAGVFEATYPLACSAPLDGGSAISADPAPGSGDGASDSGCAMTRGGSSDALGFAAPLGLVFAMRLVFRRRRSARART